MRPTPIPSDEVWTGADRRVFSAPDGDLTHEVIAPVEVLVDQTAVGHRYSVRLQLEDGDLEQLTAGGVVWLSFLGGVLPFSAEVKGPVQ